MRLLGYAYGVIFGESSSCAGRGVGTFAACVLIIEYTLIMMILSGWQLKICISCNEVISSNIK